MGGVERLLEIAGGGGAALHLGDVVDHVADGGDALVAPDGVEEGLVDFEAHLVELRQAGRDVVGVAHGFHGNEADAGLVAGVQGLVEGVPFGEEGRVLDHDGVQEAPLRRGHQVGRAPIVMAGEANHPGLAGAFELLGHLLELVALGPVERAGAVLARADAVDEKEVEMVGADVGKPRVDHLEHLLRPLVGMVLRDDEDFLPAVRVLGQPCAEAALGLAADVAIGSVEVADAHRPGDVEILGAVGVHHPAEADHGDLAAATAQGAHRERHALRSGGGRRRVRQQRGSGGDGSGKGEGGFEEVAAGGRGVHERSEARLEYSQESPRRQGGRVGSAGGRNGTVRRCPRAKAGRSFQPLRRDNFTAITRYFGSGLRRSVSM